MILEKEHIEILKHTKHRAANGLYCGDSPEMTELCNNGLMEYAGRTSFVPDPYYRLTDEGNKILSNIEQQ